MPMWSSGWPSKTRLKFVGLLILLYALSLTPVCQYNTSGAVVAYASASNAILRGLGEDTEVMGVSISSAHYAIAVIPSCVGFEYIGFLFAAMLCFPVPFRYKVLGTLVAAPLVLALNVLRIAFPPKPVPISLHSRRGSGLASLGHFRKLFSSDHHHGTTDRRYCPLHAEKTAHEFNLTSRLEVVSPESVFHRFAGIG
jgi:hypothetical protein